MSQPVLTTKFYIPPFHPASVSRPRLMEKLDAGLVAGSRLTLVSAPAGYGKTTLVSEWICHLQEGFDRPVFPGSISEAPFEFAWLSLDEADNDLLHFIRYFVIALQQVDGCIRASTQGLIDTPGTIQSSELLVSVLNAVAGAKAQVFLVLDDYQVIQSLAVHQWLDALIEKQPPNLHLVIVTRTDPLLRLSRLRARRQLVELRSEDLRFTREETEAFLNQTMGLGLTADRVAVLDNQTEGWAAGLQLAALSLEDEPDPDSWLKNFNASDRYVIDYLVEEVFHRQPEDVQHFLLHTSILNRMSAPLCAQVLGSLAPGTPADPLQAQTMLEQLERANLFVVHLDSQRTWYRYHTLFSGLLRQRLVRTLDGPSLSRLNLAASQWFEQNDLLSEAVQYTQAAGDRDRLSRLVELHGLQMIQCRAGGLPETWLDGLDEAYLSRQPLLAAVLAFSELFSHPDPPGRVEAKIEAAEQALANQPDPRDSDGRPIRDTVLGLIAALRSATGRVHGMSAQQMIQYAQDALQLLPPEFPLARYNACRAIYSAYLMQGSAAAATLLIEQAIQIAAQAGDEYHRLSSIFSQAHLAAYQGDLPLAARICQQAQAEVAARAEPGCGSQPGLGTLDIWLGRIYLERNNLSAAEQYLHDGLEKLRCQYEIYMKMRAWTWLAQIAWLAGDETEAMAYLDKARETWSGAGRYVDYQQARLWLQRAAPGDLERAVRWAGSLQLDTENEPLMRSMMLDGEWFHGEQMTLVRVQLAQRRAGQSLDLQPLLEALEVQQAVAETCQWGERLVEIWLLKALAYQALGRRDTAYAAVSCMLELAEQGEYLRTILDEGEPMRSLLEEYRQTQPGNAGSAYLERLVAAFSSARAQAPQSRERLDQAGLVEPLSERELEVLQLLAAGLSNIEISRKLYLSPNTLKAHTQNIYSKLDVHSRMQAVIRGRELGLLAAD